MGGKPVPYFGVILSTNFMSSLQSKPFAIHTRDGRFAVHGVPPRSWDIIIVAPHVGTFIAPGREVTEGAVLDLGDIVMTRGPTIVGHVTDRDGRPIADARVRITTSSLYPPTDELTEMSLGNFETRSDQLGAYRIDGASRSALAHVSASIVATSGALHTSEELPVPHANATIDLIVRDAGAIDGVVGLDVHRGAVVAAHPVSGIGMARYAEVGPDRRFRFDNLLVGEYELQLLPRHGASPPPVLVTVLASERATTTLKPPAQAITVTVNVKGRECVGVELMPVDTATRFPFAVAMEQCTGSSAEITGVAPGRYEACVVSSCAPIEVLAQPARQKFELRATP